MYLLPMFLATRVKFCLLGGSMICICEFQLSNVSNTDFLGQGYSLKFKFETFVLLTLGAKFFFSTMAV